MNQCGTCRATGPEDLIVHREWCPDNLRTTPPLDYEECQECGQPMHADRYAPGYCCAECAHSQPF